MAATDYQSLATQTTGYAGLPGLSAADLLKLALLKQIAAIVAPNVQTDYQSLISSANVGGYAAIGPASTATLLELALLQIIAQNVGGTGGPTVTSGAGSPTGVAPTGSLYIKTSDNTLWDYNGGWNALV